MRVAVTNRMCILPGPLPYYPAQGGLPSARSLPTSTRRPTGSHAMSDASFALLENRGILTVSGGDRRSFLQGLVSNDVEKVSPVEARYAALLTAQGKYLHDFVMVEFDGAV